MDEFQILAVVAAAALLFGIFLAGDGDIRVSYSAVLLFGSTGLGFTALAYEALTWSDDHPEWRIDHPLFHLFFGRTDRFLTGAFLFWQLIFAVLMYEILTGRYSEFMSPLFSGFSLKYDPLKTSRAEIRLLTILESADSTSVICCTLQHVSLVTNAGEYKTLSYCWGDQGVTKTIYVTGQAVRITVNLEAALRQLRADGHSRIWVDALCINQNDLEERSLQVRDMKAIYSRATEVIVWVGEEEDSSSEVLDFMEATKNHSIEDFVTAYDNLHIGDIYGVPSGVSRYSFDAFFKRPFWQRVWIIQEIAVASALRLYCGQRHVEWKIVSNHVNLVREYHQHKETGLIPIAAESLLRFRSTFKISRPLSLMTALFESRGFLATDPRDKVYALVGLTYDGASLIPILNYHQSVESIFYDLAKSIIINSRSLDIIALQNSDGKKRHHLPSWVPDWSDLQDSPRPWQRGLFSSDSVTELNGKRLWEGRVTNIQSLGAARWINNSVFEDGALKVSGRRIDTVDGLSGCFRSDITQVRSTANPYGAARVTAVQNTLAFYSSRSSNAKSDLSRQNAANLSVQDLEDFPIFNNWLKKNKEFFIAENYLQHLYYKKDLRLPGYGQRNGLRNYLSDVNDVLRNEMRLFGSTQGYVGMAHAQTRPGDGIFAIDGCGMLMVLRECKGGFRVIGEAYLHGFLSGGAQGVMESITLL